MNFYKKEKNNNFLFLVKAVISLSVNYISFIFVTFAPRTKYIHAKLFFKLMASKLFPVGARGVIKQKAILQGKRKAKKNNI